MAAAPPVQGTSGVAPPGETPPGVKVEDPEQPDKDKKRGFWSRLFGRGDKDDKDKAKKEKKPGGGGGA